jgi:hypothetical protein
MQVGKTVFKPNRGSDWTPERIEQLSTQDIRQLRANAERLGEAAIVAHCDGALEVRRKPAAKRRAVAAAATPPKRPRNLISRGKAFQARGVYLPGVDSSWSGVRNADGVVVFSVWAAAVVSGEGGCSCLLWAPNIDGSRPWSDMPGGKERLEHCQLALRQGGAEGLLVYGEALDGHLPEEKARTVYGVDPQLVVQLRVEQRGSDYWAVWGAKANERPL